MRSPTVLAAIPFAISLIPAPAGAQKPTKELAQVATAYAAKICASAIFISGRTLESVLAQELAPTRPLEALIKPLLRFDVDRENKTVTCQLGSAKATARMHASLGCSLVASVQVPSDALRRFATQRTPHRLDPSAEHLRHWPNTEDVLPMPNTGIDPGLLKQALDRAFAERHKHKRINTRAVVVVHKGQIVAERYGKGFHKDMALPGWSMTKTLTNALIGMRVGDGKFDLDAAIRPNAEGSAFAAPTVTDLLTMTAGLRWTEDYDDPSSDAVHMLFASTDHAKIYSEQPQAARPGRQFAYASGATNLLCKLLRESFEDDRSYWSQPARLFGHLGMLTAVLETDPSGTFVGSSYGYASARDWARFGLLYQQDGVFFGQRILPKGWVKQSTTATLASHGNYGYQIWLNAEPGGDGAKTRKWPDLPADLFSMNGHEGQYCVISPSAELVIVRLGCTKNGGFDLHGLLREVHAAAAATPKKN